MQTVDFYNSKSKELIKRYDNADMSELHKLFLQYIKPKCSVLDIGFGSGRDLEFLKEHNYKIWGNDYQQAMPLLFKSQIEVALTSNSKSLDTAIESLCKKSDYLIFDRGHEAFNL